jgi:hypothetical protein
VQLAAGDDPELAAIYDAMLHRETNRHRGDRIPIPAQILELLGVAARNEGGRLQILSGSAELDRAAATLAAADRIRFLTPRLHAQEHGLAVQSVSSALLYAHDDVDFRELSPAFAGGCAICNTISPSWPTPGQESRRCWYSGLVAHRDRR